MSKKACFEAHTGGSLSVTDFYLLRLINGAHQPDDDEGVSAYSVVGGRTQRANGPVAWDRKIPKGELPFRNRPR